ncbi:hypothetical protein WA026_001768 [Henosepilachna vigintioctopunctata]|uniref:ESF1-like protein n=1 Tax=Henosepilachna vigintioctopunctata TaxID=420089 RepID=A0AAW1UUC0_9CUCU
MEDDRFKHISNDAKFRRIPKKEQKVKIDSRFQSMFDDQKFKQEYKVDQRGRPIKGSSTHDLKRYYHLSSSEESSLEEDETHESDELKKLHVDDKKVCSKVKQKLKNLKVNYARGEKALFSESSSDDESELDECEESIEHRWGELDAEADTTEEITHRLAVCNMDWDRIHAVDIWVLLNSFLPPGGEIQSVKIYLSEFGKKRLLEEDISGPTELRESKLEDEAEETEEGSDYHMEKLRQYQLNRLKYYYAVVSFSDANAANKVYIECDGMEYESSATRLDLRFIPDSLQFDEEPKEVCDKMPEMKKYQPRFFITTALQQAKVDLTWDETDPDRIDFTEKLNSGKIEDVEQAVLQNYLGSGSEDDSEEEQYASDKIECENPVEKYRALLQSIEEKEKEKQSRDIQMEVTWGLETEKRTKELVKKKIAEKEEKTPFQQYLDKRKEKRKEKKKLKNLANGNNLDEDSDIPSDIDMNDPFFAEEFNNSEFAKKKGKNKNTQITKHDEIDERKQAELELLLMNDERDDRKHFNLKSILQTEGPKKSKRKETVEESKDDDFEVDVSDARFSAIYSNHHFNIDPSDPHYKKTKGMETLINENLKGELKETQSNLQKKIK